MRYTPNTVGDPRTQAELERIGQALAEPDVGVVTYELMHAKPAKAIAGQVCYFAPGVTSSGSAEGLYILKSSGWVLLG